MELPTQEAVNVAAAAIINQNVQDTITLLWYILAMFIVISLISIGYQELRLKSITDLFKLQLKSNFDKIEELKVYVKTISESLSEISTKAISPADVQVVCNNTCEKHEKDCANYKSR